MRELYRKAPLSMLILLLNMAVLVYLDPRDPVLWVGLWHQAGFTLLSAIQPPYLAELGSPWRVCYWAFREALCWPYLLYRYCKGKIE